jgi:hypothetical protein
MVMDFQAILARLADGDPALILPALTAAVVLLAAAGLADLFARDDSIEARLATGSADRAGPRRRAHAAPRARPALPMLCARAGRPGADAGVADPHWSRKLLSAKRPHHRKKHRWGHALWPWSAGGFDTSGPVDGMRRVDALQACAVCCAYLGFLLRLARR